MLKFCPECDYCLYIKNEVDAEGVHMIYECKTCGYTKREENGGLIMETVVQEQASDSYKVYLNEFTLKDPTLPHTTTLKCPNGACNSNSGTVEPDVIYIKYDAAHMKFLYICTHCKTHWRTR
jgi:DNA-directed RNA polymerase subunit M/transcription elongation factor TFIIS